jgi:hypothetical protein
MKKIFLAAFIALGSTAFGQTQVNDKTVEEKLNEQYCTGLFKSADGMIFDLESTPVAGAYLNILDWLDGRAAGLKVYKTRNGTRTPYIRGQVASIYVDEILVNASYLNSLPSSDIAMIKVIRSPFMGNTAGNGGAIAIYTFAVEPDEEEEK